MARGLLVLCVTLLALGSPSLVRAGPLVTGVQEPYIENSGARDLLLDRIAGSGSTATRVWLYWDWVAPNGRPSDPSNPADPAYDWSNVDGQVQAARARGLRVILNIHQTPAWAAAGNWDGRAVARAPVASELGLLARAAALRYYGQVFDWEIWNEPNLPYFFVPQLNEFGHSVAPALYRELVNAAAASLHGVDPRNNVVAGALAPFGPAEGHAPLDFMRRLLCMSGGATPRPTCDAKINFDSWSTHPYTMGGPTHQAFWPESVSIGDLPEMRRVLRAAVRAGHVVSSQSVRFWVTEFSWETNGPDPQGVPHRRHARWTSEALYRMWNSGVSLVTWWLLRDRPFPGNIEQSGFFYCGRVTLQDESECDSQTVANDVRKRSTQAFRFPFVALPRNGRVFTWGRTPGSRPAAVVIERRIGSRWVRVGRLRANQHGIFFKTWSSSPGGSWRARLARPGGERSLAFTAQRTRDIPLAHPFGCGGGLPC